MASKSSGKTLVTLRGGPFSGCKFPINIMHGTFKFTAKGYLGQYDGNGKWIGAKIGMLHEPNDNIILSTN
jgi:hypothetical protein